MLGDRSQRSSQETDISLVSGSGRGDQQIIVWRSNCWNADEATQRRCISSVVPSAWGPTLAIPGWIAENPCHPPCPYCYIRRPQSPCLQVVFFGDTVSVSSICTSGVKCPATARQMKRQPHTVSYSVRGYGYEVPQSYQPVACDQVKVNRSKLNRQVLQDA